MVRGSNTKGMAGFPAFSLAAGAAGSPLANARFVGPDDEVNARDSVSDQCSRHGKGWIIGRRVWGAIPFASTFHRLYVRLAGLPGGGSSIKTLRLLKGAILPAPIGHGQEAAKVGCAGIFFKAETTGSVRGPPRCGRKYELRV